MMGEYWFWYAVFIPLGVASVSSPLWRFLRYFETVFHEFGHALVGILLGLRLHGFKLRFDTSGETVMLAPVGLRSLAVTLGGYPAPIILGFLTLFYGYMGHSPQVIWLLIGVVVFIALFIRNFFGFIPLIIVFLGCWLGVWLDGYGVQGSFIVTVILGSMLITGGLRSLTGVFLQLPEGSDAEILKGMTGLPQRLWLVLMFILSIVFIYLDIIVINWFIEHFSTLNSDVNSWFTSTFS